MSNCKLFSTNKNLYERLKKEFLSFPQERSDFDNFVIEKYTELKNSPFKVMMEKFVTDEDITQIAMR